jgi:hypothetical protein
MQNTELARASVWGVLLDGSQDGSANGMWELNGREEALWI